MQNLGLQNSILEKKIRNTIKILSTLDFLCRKFAVSVGKMKNCNFLSCPLFQLTAKNVWKLTGKAKAKDWSPNKTSYNFNPSVPAWWLVPEKEHSDWPNV